MLTSTSDFVEGCSSEVALGVDLDNLQNIFVFFFSFLSSILALAIVFKRRKPLALIAKLIFKIKRLFGMFFSKVKPR